MSHAKKILAASRPCRRHPGDDQRAREGAVHERREDDCGNLGGSLSRHLAARRQVRPRPLAASAREGVVGRVWGVEGPGSRGQQGLLRGRRRGAGSCWVPARWPRLDPCAACAAHVWGTETHLQCDGAGVRPTSGGGCTSHWSCPGLRTRCGHSMHSVRAACSHRLGAACVRLQRARRSSAGCFRQ